MIKKISDFIVASIVVFICAFGLFLSILYIYSPSTIKVIESLIFPEKSLTFDKTIIYPNAKIILQEGNYRFIDENHNMLEQKFPKTTNMSCKLLDNSNVIVEAPLEENNQKVKFIFTLTRKNFQDVLFNKIHAYKEKQRKAQDKKFENFLRGLGKVS